MKKFLLFSSFFGCFFFSALAQLSFQGTPKSFSTDGITFNVPSYDLPSIDNDKLINEDLLNQDKGNPLRIGVNHNVNLNMNNSGRWDILPNGDRFWRLALKSQDATSLHLNMDKFQIPQGAEVFLYTPDHQDVAGKYDSRSTLENGNFYSPDIPGDQLILEYFQPSSVTGKPEISIYQVGHMYRSTNEIKGPHGDAVGDCHINVACEEVNPWRDQANSVVLIKITSSDGVFVCSGAMLNNTRQDNTPYVFTAEHCYDPNVTAWRFVFEYQTNACDGTTGSYNKYANGATVVAKDDASDFMLLQITGPINENYKPNIFLAGWDRSGSVPTVGAAIHHPGGDYKKYSKPRVVTSGNGSYNKFWTVGWLPEATNKGTTEPGSSGSPLFNAAGYVVGSLCCGTSSCFYIDQYNVGPNGYDNYGKLSYSWTNNNTSLNSRKLQPWLDPNNLGHVALAGRYWNNTVSVAENEVSKTFKVVPNPSNGSFSLSDIQLNNTGTIFVYDALGKLHYKASITTNQQLNFNLPTLNNGLYFIEIQSDNQTYRSKLMIVK